MICRWSSAHPARIAGTYRTVVEACRAHGKFTGIGGVYEEGLMRRYIGLGIRLVLGGGDLGFMTAAATERAKMLRNCCGVTEGLLKKQ